MMFVDNLMVNLIVSVDHFLKFSFETMIEMVPQKDRYLNRIVIIGPVLTSIGMLEHKSSVDHFYQTSLARTCSIVTTTKKVKQNSYITQHSKTKMYINVTQ